MNATTYIQNNKMIKHKWGSGIMNELGKLEKKVKRNYVIHTEGMSF